MTSIKSPQTVSHKSNGGHGGHGFITLLLLLTWLALGAGFYGIKIGVIQSPEINPAVSEKLSAMETKITALDSRLKVVEKRLTDASSVLNPAPTTESTVKPEAAVKPEGEKSASPEKIEEPKKPDGGASVAPSTDPILAERKESPKPAQPEEKGTPNTKPQTNSGDKSGSRGDTALLEKKKSYLISEIRQEQSTDENRELVICAVNLRDAVKKPREYDKELESLKVYSGGDSYINNNIALLEKNAKNGISNISTLQNEFSSSSDKILKQALVAKQDKSIVDKIYLKFFSVVNIRKVSGDENSNKIEDIFARARKYVDLGNIELAVSEISKLGENDKKSLAEWLQKAKSYSASINASEDILKYVTRPKNKYGQQAARGL